MAFDPDKYLQSKKAIKSPPIEEIEPSEDKLSLGDVAAMVGQGATFKFGDELLGAIKAAKEVALTDKELADFPELYRQRQKEEEAKYEALEEAHPGMAFAGELAGGFLIPGGFLAKGGLKGATAMQKALEAAKMGAKVGAIAGAGASKADVSDIEALGKDVLGGAAGGAILGGGLSAAGTAIPKAFSSIIAKGEKADTPIIRNFAAAVRKGYEGKKLLSDTALTEIDEEARTAASDLEKQIEATRKAASEDITRILTQAKEEGALVSPDEKITEGLALLGRNLKTEKLTTPTVDAKIAKQIAKTESKVASGKLSRTAADEEIKRLRAAAAGVGAEFEQALSSAGSEVSKTPHQMQGILDKLTSLVKGELDPQDAYNLALDLEKLDSKLLPPDLVKAIKTAAKKSADVTLEPRMQQELSSQMAQLRSKLSLGQITEEQYTEEASKLLNQYGPTPATRAFQKEQDIKKSLAETIIGEGRHPDYLNKELRDLGYTAPTKIYDIITEKVIDKLSDPSTTGDNARVLMTEIEKNIGILNKNYPELNLNFKDLLQRIKNVSQDVTLRKKILSEQGKTDAAVTGVLDKLTNLVGYGGAYGISSAVGAGKRRITDFNNFITRASDATLLPIAKQLQSTPGVNHIGAALEGAINNKSVAAKNAAIFSIMQNPNSRQVISDFVDQEE